VVLKRRNHNTFGPTSNRNIKGKDYKKNVENQFSELCTGWGVKGAARKKLTLLWRFRNLTSPGGMVREWRKNPQKMETRGAKKPPSADKGRKGMGLSTECRVISGSGWEKGPSLEVSRTLHKEKRGRTRKY